MSESGWKQTDENHWSKPGFGVVERKLVLRVEGWVYRFLPYDPDGYQLDAGGYNTVTDAIRRILTERKEKCLAPVKQTMFIVVEVDRDDTRWDVTQAQQAIVSSVDELIYRFNEPADDGLTIDGHATVYRTLEDLQADIKDGHLTIHKGE